MSELFVMFLMMVISVVCLLMSVAPRSLTEV